MRPFALSILAGLGFACLLHAQSPEPFVAPGVAPALARTTTVTADPKSTDDLIKTLKEMKAANEETLRTQANTLLQLDELQKAADQIRINTRRS